MPFYFIYFISEFLHGNFSHRYTVLYIGWNFRILRSFLEFSFYETDVRSFPKDYHLLISFEDEIFISWFYWFANVLRFLFLLTLSCFKRGYERIDHDHVHISYGVIIKALELIFVFVTTNTLLFTKKQTVSNKSL